MRRIREAIEAGVFQTFRRGFLEAYHSAEGREADE
jgi:queuine/archaeosine tRNA-ribosyltransferase